jgi:hypothetical protein
LANLAIVGKIHTKENTVAMKNKMLVPKIGLSFTSALKFAAVTVDTTLFLHKIMGQQFNEVSTYL